MKNYDTGILTFIYRFLLALVICLALVFLGGTVYSLLIRQENGREVSSVPDRTFTGIGRLRCPMADSGSAGQDAVAVITVTFPYAPEDRAFSEELAARVKDFRSIVGDYILSFKTEELKKMNEDQFKNELLDRFNAVLRLGNIETLYFNDFMILD